MKSESERQRVASVLSGMCGRRGIPATGGALASVLRAAGHPIHAYTLGRLLRGESSPRRSTIDEIARGLGASAAERALLLGPEPKPSARHLISVPEVLLRELREDSKARVEEEVLWWHEVGLADEDDVCVQQRRTVVGPEGLRAIGFSPGQVGDLIFDSVDTARLGLEVSAMRLSPHGEERVLADAHFAEIDPSRNQYRIVVRFSETIRDELIVWTVRFHWPGFWRSLRDVGTSSHRLRLGGGEPIVTKTTFEVVAPAPEFDDLMFVRRSPDLGTVERQRVEEKVLIRWLLPTPPSVVSFDIHAPRHFKRMVPTDG